MPKIGLQIEVKLNTGAFSTMALQASKMAKNHDAALNEIFVNLLGRYLATQDVHYDPLRCFAKA